VEPFEDRLYKRGYRHVIGVDEAGRGPLAGPVVAAAVCLSGVELVHPVRDSKLLTTRRREAAFGEILEKAVVGTGVMSEAVIDEVNILNATYLAMRNAVESACARLGEMFPPKGPARRDVFLLIDGDRFESDLPYDYQTVVGGDNRSLSVAAASIIAKVTRDRLLLSYDQVYPQYGFARHKGYPTREHKKAIAKHGLTPIHRRSYSCQ
jgi:ribonuclease HII